MALVTYQCCFCGEHVDENSELNPCFIQIDSNFGMEESEQLRQAFFCHYGCFKSSLDPGVAMHLNFEGQNKKSRGRYMAPAKVR